MTAAMLGTISKCTPQSFPYLISQCLARPGPMYCRLRALFACTLHWNTTSHLGAHSVQFNCARNSIVPPLHLPVSARSGTPPIAMANFGRETLLVQLYQHAVLPRQVSGREDKDLYRIESELLRRLSDAVKSLVPHTPLEDLADIDAVRLALTTCSALNVDGKIDRTMLIKEMRQLVSNQELILHVTEQNAALLIYPHTR
jgi:hypothetical protein